MLILDSILVSVFWWKSVLWKQSTIQRVPSEREWRPIFKVNRNQMEIRKGKCALCSIFSQTWSFMWSRLVKCLIPPLCAGSHQAVQSDTEQGRQEEATWRTWEFLHLVHRPCWCRCWRAWGGYQGRHLAKPPAVLPGMFTSNLMIETSINESVLDGSAVHIFGVEVSVLVWQNKNMLAW